MYLLFKIVYLFSGFIVSLLSVNDENLCPKLYNPNVCTALEGTHLCLIHIPHSKPKKDITKTTK